MEIEKLQTYQDVVDSLIRKKRIKHLLFGNGFSMAYDHKIFSYNALSDFIEKTGDPTIALLFQKLNTKNFELIMQQLDNFIEIGIAFGVDTDTIKRIQDASLKLKSSLIDAVKALHPEHVFSVPQEKGEACMAFLQEFINNSGLVFSTNYDLLLYWVLMRFGATNAIDGFGRDLLTTLDPENYVDPSDLEYSELRWGKHKEEQTIHYLHGTLPIFDTGVVIEKEEYGNEKYLLENVKSRIDKKEYPIFVTAGNGTEKLNHIMHNRYLSFCYERLCNIQGSLITFGFNFGDYDTHIIDAINIAAKMGKKVHDKLWSVYIGVYADEDLEHINKISDKFKCKVTPFNARTVNLWG